MLSVFVLLAVLSVGLLVHQLLDVLGVLHAHLEHPSVLFSLVVDDGRIALDILVVCCDLSCDWGVHVGCCLN